MAQRIFTTKIFTTTAIVVVVVLAILLVVFAVDALLLIFAAILLAILFRSLSDLLHRRTGISEGLSLLLVTLALVGIFALAIYLLAPNIADQVRELRRELPQSFERVRGQLAQQSWGRTILEQIPATDEIYKTIGSGNIFFRATGFFSTTLGIFAKLGFFVVLAIFLAIEPRTYVEGFLRLVPPARRDRAREVLDALGETLQWWLVGKAGSMLTIGVLTWIGLWLLGVPLSLALGIITALLTFIPNFGPLLSVIPAALLAFTQEPIRALYVVFLYIGVQLIESNLITPMIERRTIKLPSALTAALQLILSVFVGGLGLVLATPLVAVGLVLVRMLYVEDVLGDRIETPDDEQNKETTEDTKDAEGKQI